MNYIGSKKSLLSFLNESINAVVGKTAESFCDIFAGTGAVGTYFKRKGYRIIANDIQYYAYVLNRHYVGNHKPLPFNGLADELSLSKISTEERAAAVCVFWNSWTVYQVLFIRIMLWAVLSGRILNGCIFLMKMQKNAMLSE